MSVMHEGGAPIDSHAELTVFSSVSSRESTILSLCSQGLLAKISGDKRKLRGINVGKRLTGKRRGKKQR